VFVLAVLVLVSILAYFAVVIFIPYQGLFCLFCGGHHGFHVNDDCRDCQLTDYCNDFIENCHSPIFRDLYLHKQIKLGQTTSRLLM